MMIILIIFVTAIASHFFFGMSRGGAHLPLGTRPFLSCSCPNLGPNCSVLILFYMSRLLSLLSLLSLAAVGKYLGSGLLRANWCLHVFELASFSCSLLLQACA